MKISGWKIRVEREQYGITRGELAAKLGWRVSLLEDIEAGVAEPGGDVGRWAMDAIAELAEKKFDEL
jgi:ribosome-binding protein aMBF1 (putative translation factor)